MSGRYVSGSVPSQKLMICASGRLLQECPPHKEENILVLQVVPGYIVGAYECYSPYQMPNWECSP